MVQQIMCVEKNEATTPSKKNQLKSPERSDLWSIGWYNKFERNTQFWGYFTAKCNLKSSLLTAVSHDQPPSLKTLFSQSNPMKGLSPKQKPAVWWCFKFITDRNQACASILFLVFTKVDKAFLTCVWNYWLICRWKTCQIYCWWKACRRCQELCDLDAVACRTFVSHEVNTWFTVNRGVQLSNLQREALPFVKALFLDFLVCTTYFAFQNYGTLVILVRLKSPRE